MWGGGGGGGGGVVLIPIVHDGGRQMSGRMNDMYALPRMMFIDTYTNLNTLLAYHIFILFKLNISC